LSNASYFFVFAKSNQKTRLQICDRFGCHKK
jgi:hypothetical protein